MPRGKGKTSPERRRTEPDQLRAGRLEGPRDDFLIGWAWDTGAAGAHARLLIGSDVGHRLEVVADEPREDVEAAGHGDGHAGFRIPLRELAYASLVSCRWADSGVHLDGSPQALPRAFDPAPPDGTRRTGHVERGKGGMLTGWALDLDRPGERARIRVRSDAGHDFELVADQHRADVQAAGLGDGHAGFKMSLRRLAGAAAVSLRWADTGAHLTGSPVALHGEAEPAGGPLATGQGPGWILRVDPCEPAARTVGGYFANLQDLGRHQVITLEQGGRVIGRARACRFHPDAPGDRMHGFCFVLEAPLPPGPCVVRDGEEGRELATFEAPT